jgi:hypothetical protein
MRNGKSYKEHALQPGSWAKTLIEDGSLTFVEKKPTKGKAVKRTSKGNAARRRQRAKAIKGKK